MSTNTPSFNPHSLVLELQKIPTQAEKLNRILSVIIDPANTIERVIAQMSHLDTLRIEGIGRPMESYFYLRHVTQEYKLKIHDKIQSFKRTSTTAISKNKDLVSGVGEPVSTGKLMTNPYTTDKLEIYSHLITYLNEGVIRGDINKITFERVLRVIYQRYTLKDGQYYLEKASLTAHAQRQETPETLHPRNQTYDNIMHLDKASIFPAQYVFQHAPYAHTSNSEFILCDRRASSSRTTHMNAWLSALNEEEIKRFIPKGSLSHVAKVRDFYLKNDFSHIIHELITNIDSSTAYSDDTKTQLYRVLLSEDYRKLRTPVVKQLSNLNIKTTIMMSLNGSVDWLTKEQLLNITNRFMTSTQSMDTITLGKETTKFVEKYQLSESLKTAHELLILTLAGSLPGNVLYQQVQLYEDLNYSDMSIADKPECLQNADYVKQLFNTAESISGAGAGAGSSDRQTPLRLILISKSKIEEALLKQGFYATLSQMHTDAEVRYEMSIRTLKYAFSHGDKSTPDAFVSFLNAMPHDISSSIDAHDLNQLKDHLEILVEVAAYHELHPFEEGGEYKRDQTDEGLISEILIPYYAGRFIADVQKLGFEKLIAQRIEDFYSLFASDLNKHPRTRSLLESLGLNETEKKSSANDLNLNELMTIIESQASAIFYKLTPEGLRTTLIYTILGIPKENIPDNTPQLQSDIFQSISLIRYCNNKLPLKVLEPFLAKGEDAPTQTQPYQTPGLSTTIEQQTKSIQTLSKKLRIAKARLSGQVDQSKTITQTIHALSVDALVEDLQLPGLQDLKLQKILKFITHDGTSQENAQELMSRLNSMRVPNIGIEMPSHLYCTYPLQTARSKTYRSTLTFAPFHEYSLTAMEPSNQAKEGFEGWINTNQYTTDKLEIYSYLLLYLKNSLRNGGLDKAQLEKLLHMIYKLYHHTAAPSSERGPHRKESFLQPAYMRSHSDMIHTVEGKPLAGAGNMTTYCNTAYLENASLFPAQIAFDPIIKGQSFNDQIRINPKYIEDLKQWLSTFSSSSRVNFMDSSGTLYLQDTFHVLHQNLSEMVYTSTYYDNTQKKILLRVLLCDDDFFNRFTLNTGLHLLSFNVNTELYTALLNLLIQHTKPDDFVKGLLEKGLYHILMDIYHCEESRSIMPSNVIEMAIQFGDQSNVADFISFIRKVSALMACEVTSRHINQIKTEDAGTIVQIAANIRISDPDALKPEAVTPYYVGQFLGELYTKHHGNLRELLKERLTQFSADGSHVLGEHQQAIMLLGSIGYDLADKASSDPKHTHDHESVHLNKLISGFNEVAHRTFFARHPLKSGGFRTKLIYAILGIPKEKIPTVDTQLRSNIIDFMALIHNNFLSLNYLNPATDSPEAYPSPSAPALESESEVYPLPSAPPLEAEIEKNRKIIRTLKEELEHVYALLEATQKTAIEAVDTCDTDSVTPCAPGVSITETEVVRGAFVLSSPTVVSGRVASWISRDENEAKVLEKAQHMLYM